MFPGSTSLVAWRFRRLALTPSYVHRSLAGRIGECRRCGACCHLRSFWPMPMLKPLRCLALDWAEDGFSRCVIHDRRPGLCRVFPIDAVDLAARNIIAPRVPCGYAFLREGSR